MGDPLANGKAIIREFGVRDSERGSIPPSNK